MNAWLWQNGLCLPNLSERCFSLFFSLSLSNSPSRSTATHFSRSSPSRCCHPVNVSLSSSLAFLVYVLAANGATPRSQGRHHTPERSNSRIAAFGNEPKVKMKSPKNYEQFFDPCCTIFVAAFLLSESLHHRFSSSWRTMKKQQDLIKSIFKLPLLKFFTNVSSKNKKDPPEKDLSVIDITNTTRNNSSIKTTHLNILQILGKQVKSYAATYPGCCESDWRYTRFKTKNRDSEWSAKISSELSYPSMKSCGIKDVV